MGKPAGLKLKPNIHRSATSNSLERIPFFTEVVYGMFGSTYGYFVKGLNSTVFVTLVFLETILIILIFI